MEGIAGASRKTWGKIRACENFRFLGARRLQ
jgi:hypothetical protein